MLLYTRRGAAPPAKRRKDGLSDNCPVPGRSTATFTHSYAPPRISGLYHIRPGWQNTHSFRIRAESGDKQVPGHASHHTTPTRPQVHSLLSQATTLPAHCHQGRNSRSPCSHSRPAYFFSCTSCFRSPCQSSARSTAPPWPRTSTSAAGGGRSRGAVNQSAVRRPFPPHDRGHAKAAAGQPGLRCPSPQDVKEQGSLRAAALMQQGRQVAHTAEAAPHQPSNCCRRKQQGPSSTDQPTCTARTHAHDFLKPLAPHTLSHPGAPPAHHPPQRGACARTPHPPPCSPGSWPAVPAAAPPRRPSPAAPAPPPPAASWAAE